VLIVDDEEPNRLLLKRILATDGISSIAVADGEAALAFIHETPPDLVLLDVVLPGLDGFSVCRRIKQLAETRLIPVVLVTGLANRHDRIQGIDVGADDFITKPVDLHELRARVRSLLRIKSYTDELDSADAIINSLALTIEARDEYTEGHCERLARYAVALGWQLRLVDAEIAALDRGGYLHDIGKISIPDAVLRKPGPLTDEEVELMKQHPVVGDRLCGELRSLRLVRQIVRHHHELRDGSGYPDGLRGDQIPLIAQIVGIVDVYDALTTKRPYREPMSSEAACAELKADVTRGHRRGDLVDVFIELNRSGAFGTPVAVRQT
jgi:putative two-component system response regulator